MIRRSLRIGIRLGMLAGLVFALFKIIEARRPLPAGPGDDPWAPSRQPEPGPASAPAPARPTPAPKPVPVDEGPPLVEPTMLQSTSLRRSPTRVDDRAFDPASTAPPVVSPADPFAPTAAATPSPSPLVAAEIEPDDDEIVMLSTGVPEPPPAPAPAAAAKAPAAAATSSTTTVPTAKAPATKAPATRAPATRAPATKAPATKASARKAPTRKAAPKKAAPDTAGRKRPGSRKAAAWVDPDGGVCPTTHPVKAKLRSAIFHLPGMAAYARTNPDRCYRDEAAALDDGLRKAAR